MNACGDAETVDIRAAEISGGTVTARPAPALLEALKDHTAAAAKSHKEAIAYETGFGAQGQPAPAARGDSALANVAAAARAAAIAGLRALRANGAETETEEIPTFFGLAADGQPNRDPALERKWRHHPGLAAILLGVTAGDDDSLGDEDAAPRGRRRRKNGDGPQFKLLPWYPSLRETADSWGLDPSQRQAFYVIVTRFLCEVMGKGVLAHLFHNEGAPPDVDSLPRITMITGQPGVGKSRVRSDVRLERTRVCNRPGFSRRSS